MSDSEKMLKTQIALLEQQIDTLRTREKAFQERVRALEAQGTAQSRSDQEIIRFERQHALEEMAHGVRDKDPKVVNVLMTGWEVLDSDDLLTLFDFRIQKPFRLAEMMSTVKEAADRSAEKRNQ